MEKSGPYKKPVQTNFLGGINWYNTSGPAHGQELAARPKNYVELMNGNYLPGSFFGSPPKHKVDYKIGSSEFFYELSNTLNSIEDANEILTPKLDTTVKINKVVKHTGGYSTLERRDTIIKKSDLNRVEKMDYQRVIDFQK